MAVLPPAPAEYTIICNWIFTLGCFCYAAYQILTSIFLAVDAIRDVSPCWVCKKKHKGGIL